MTKTDTMHNDIQKSKETKSARKKENRRKRKWKKAKSVWKKMLPWLCLAIALGGLLVILLRLWAPHYDAADVSVKQGRVIDVYQQEVLTRNRYTPRYQVILVFEDGFQGYVQVDKVKDEFDYERFLTEYKNETMVVKYTDWQSVRAANLLLDIADADGNSYLAMEDINESHRGARHGLEIIYGVIALFFLFGKYLAIESTTSA